MTFRSICTRTATIALAATALAAPAASARPADMPPALAETTAAAQDQQDLRSADAIDAATRPALDSQDLRSADAIDAATRPALDSQANTRAHTTPKASAERSMAWATIAIGIAGSLLALGIIAGIASRTRRTARARITA
jgi:hypothetical protein